MVVFSDVKICVHCDKQVKGKELKDSMDILREPIHNDCYYQRRCLRIMKGQNPPFIDVSKEAKKKKEFGKPSKKTFVFDTPESLALICAYAEGYDDTEKPVSRTGKKPTTS